MLGGAPPENQPNNQIGNGSEDPKSQNIAAEKGPEDECPKRGIEPAATSLAPPEIKSVKKPQKEPHQAAGPKKAIHAAHPPEKAFEG